MRIACASGFWGDRDDVLLEQVRGGPVDVVMADYLAEVTMAILRRQRAQDPRAGWARDFAKALDPALEDIAERGIAVVTNAGGMNPRACAEAVLEAARRRGIGDLPVGVALNFVLHGALDGGALVSLRMDPQGKTYGLALLRMEIEVPDDHPIERLVR